eukprot:2861200-Pyramimonas_sp.AAC.1
MALCNSPGCPLKHATGSRLDRLPPFVVLSNRCCPWVRNEEEHVYLKHEIYGTNVRLTVAGNFQETTKEHYGSLSGEHQR